MAQHQERSRVWRYFTRSSDNLKAKCHLCLAFLSFKGGSISNLHLHLRRKHSEHLDEQSGALIKDTLPNPLKNIEKIEFFKNDDNVKKLIELVRQRGNILYKFSRDNLWNSETQEKLWKEVAYTFGCQVTHVECRQCWRNLRYLYDLYKKDSKTSTIKFIEQLKFLDSLYARPKISSNFPLRVKKRKTPTIETGPLLDDIVIVENEKIDGEDCVELLMEEENDNFAHLNHFVNFENEENHLEQDKSKFLKSNKMEMAEKSLSFYKNFDEMDDLDFFLGFLNKKMRFLPAEEKSFVEMRFTQLIFEAEAGLLQ